MVRTEVTATIKYVYSSDFLPAQFSKQNDATDSRQMKRGDRGRIRRIPCLPP